MRSLILLIALFSTGSAHGSEWRILETNNLYFEVGKTWHLLDPFWDQVRYDEDEFGTRADSGEYYTYGIATGFDLVLAERGDFSFIWNNRVEGNSTNYQYRRVAWDHTMEMRYDKVSIYAHHLSEHLLDMETKYNYPLTDNYGIRLYFVRDGK